jgi:hypothetical protein
MTSVGGRFDSIILFFSLNFHIRFGVQFTVLAEYFWAAVVCLILLLRRVVSLIVHCCVFLTGRADEVPSARCMCEFAVPFVWHFRTSNLNEWIYLRQKHQTCGCVAQTYDTIPGNVMRTGIILRFDFSVMSKAAWFTFRYREWRGAIVTDWWRKSSST